MTIHRDWIQRHIPHQGSMCLLDAVEQWDANDIVCRAVSHCAPDNPLRHGGGLGICTGIEYAAQAMAVHGALLAGTDRAPASGYLASVRNVEWTQPRLDTAGASAVSCMPSVSTPARSCCCRGAPACCSPPQRPSPIFESEPT